MKSRYHTKPCVVTNDQKHPRLSAPKTYLKSRKSEHTQEHNHWFILLCAMDSAAGCVRHALTPTGIARNPPVLHFHTIQLAIEVFHAQEVCLVSVLSQMPSHPPHSYSHWCAGPVKNSINTGAWQMLVPALTPARHATTHPTHRCWRSG